MSNITGLLDARFLFDLLQTFVIVLLWLRRPGKEAGERVDALASEVSVLRERLNHMPLRDELTRLEGSVVAIQATLEAMKSSSTATSAAVNRIEAFLLQAGGR